MNTFIIRFTSFVFLLGLFSLIVRGEFFSASPLVIAAQALAVGILVWARLTFGRQEFNVTAIPGAGPLVQRGPYRYVRHPMYAAGLLLLWSSIIGHWSLVNAAIGLVVTIIILARVAAEERLLRSWYAEYSEYAQRTKRIIPFIY